MTVQGPIMKQKDQFSAAVTNTSTSQPGTCGISDLVHSGVFVLHVIREPHCAACGIKVTVFPAS